MILTMDLKERSYDIVIENGSLNKAGELLDLKRKVLIVSDDGVPQEYAQKVASFSKEPYIFTFKQGEDSKSLKTYEEMLAVMLEKGFSRKDCVVAVGGGVTGDLAGFVAASYMRGIDFYNIPTTTLSQIDSSIGGKTAVNFGGIKNIVGAFYQPKKVLIDPETLKTLDKRQFNSGLVEALKMAATSDAKLFELFENADIKENLIEIIVRSLKIKKMVVEQDEKESGLRKILNFGHTIAHGIEANANLYHGECVALGILPMSSPGMRERITKVLSKLEQPLEVTLDYDRVIEAIAHDKKSESGKVTVIACDKPGECVMKAMKLEEIRELLPICIKEVR